MKYRTQNRMDKEIDDFLQERILPSMGTVMKILCEAMQSDSYFHELSGVPHLSTYITNKEIYRGIRNRIGLRSIVQYTIDDRFMGKRTWLRKLVYLNRGEAMSILTRSHNIALGYMLVMVANIEMEYLNMYIYLCNLNGEEIDHVWNLLLDKLLL